MKTRSFRGFGPRLACAAVLAALALACSGQQTQPNEPAAAAPAVAAEPESGARAEPAPAESAAPADAAPPAPPQESLLSLCNKMCDAVAPKCTKTQLESCRVTCKNYEDSPPACDPVVRSALECARQDRDFLFCSNVVPEVCGKKFKAVGVCMALGEAPTEQVKKEIPDGWERFEAKSFSIVIPKGVQQKSAAGAEIWATDGPNGAHYEVKKQAAVVDRKLDNKYFLKLSRTLFGRCADKMKLHSIVEKPDETSIQFKVTCPEKTEQVGRMHVVGSDLYVLNLTYPTGGTPEIDAFVYSLKAKK
ncbi:MAG TPA: hypothetical protein VGK73_28340 [Polyangiaceae bacterium]